MNNFGEVREQARSLSLEKFHGEHKRVNIYKFIYACERGDYGIRFGEPEDGRYFPEDDLFIFLVASYFNGELIK